MRRDGAMAPPIHLATTFEHGPAYEPIYGFAYARDNNPNVSDLEARLAALEGGAGAVSFTSGMAAGAAILQSLPKGARIYFHHELYFAFKVLAQEMTARGDIKAQFIDMRSAGALEGAVAHGAEAFWFETPSNPQLELIDMAAVVAAAHAAGALSIIDGTFATPVLQQPFQHGVDIVMHAATKFMGGHSDVMGGAVIVRDDPVMDEQLRKTRKLTGGVLAPFNAWLISRGLQSLHCRMEAHSRHALRVAEALETHSAVERVNYPFLPSNPDFDLAQKQMSAGGGILSFCVKGGKQEALKAASKVKLFANATSVGGVESLIEHRNSVEGSATSTPETLLRLSVGLEHPDDLIEDLFQALDD